METKTEDTMIKEISDAMTHLLGNVVTDSMMDSIKKFDNPSDDKNQFFESAVSVFSEILGKELVMNKLQPIKEKYKISG